MLLRPAPRRAEHLSASITAAQPVDRDNAITAFEWAASEIRSGAHTTLAIHRALGLHPGVLPEVRRRLDRGLPLFEATRETASASRDTWFVHALQLCATSSESSGEVLERAVSIARERRAWSVERRAQAAQARLSARLMTLVPVGFALWGVIASPSVRSAYGASPLTLACAVAGIVLNTLGWWWMRSLVDASDIEAPIKRTNRRGVHRSLLAHRSSSQRSWRPS